MRNRPIRTSVYLNEDEHCKLCEMCKKTKLGKTTIIRLLIMGYSPPEAPSVDYPKLVRQMRAIGNNINQILIIARNNGILNVPDLKHEILELQNLEEEIRDVFRIKKADDK